MPARLKRLTYPDDLHHVLMFTSAATGMAVGAAFIRGFASRTNGLVFGDTRIGNFYFDFVRSLTRVLCTVRDHRVDFVASAGGSANACRATELPHC